jgi:hypothetical protein
MINRANFQAAKSRDVYILRAADGSLPSALYLRLPVRGGDQLPRHAGFGFAARELCTQPSGRWAVL